MMEFFPLSLAARGGAARGRVHVQQWQVQKCRRRGGRQQTHWPGGHPARLVLAASG